MSVWQRLNAPRNKRERRVAKIARNQERERIIALLEPIAGKCTHCDYDAANVIALIKGENE